MKKISNEFTPYQEKFSFDIGDKFNDLMDWFEEDIVDSYFNLINKEGEVNLEIGLLAADILIDVNISEISSTISVCTFKHVKAVAYHVQNEVAGFYIRLDHLEPPHDYYYQAYSESKILELKSFSKNFMKKWRGI